MDAGRTLYSTNDVFKMFPAGTVKEKDVIRAVKDSRAHRELNGSIFLTQRDLDRFFAWISRRRTRPPEADYDAPGLCVVLAGRVTGTDNDLLWIGWSREGEELDLLDDVQLGSQERLLVKHTFAMTHGDTAALRVRLAADNWLGQWFKKTARVTTELQKHFDIERND